jgi:hypothetical protein
MATKTEISEKLTAAGIEHDVDAMTKAQLEALLPTGGDEVEENPVLLVNADKVARAKDILDLITGKRIPKGEGESDSREKFAGFLTIADIDPKGKDALQFIYEKLGGLVRTVREQEVADEQAVEMQKKGKKRAIEA